MKTAVDLIKEMAIKAGVDVNTDEVKAVLDNAALKVEIPETLFTSIDTSLLSLDAAKNNHKEIKAAYTAKILNGLDAEINRFKDEFSISDEDYEEIKNEPTTFKKVGLLVNKIKTLESKKAGSTNKGDKDAYQKQIDELTKALTEKETAVKKAEDGFKTELSNFKKNQSLKSLISSYKTILDDVDPEVKNTSIITLINKHLQDNNVELVLDEKDNLVLQNADKTTYLGANHQKITTQAFVDSLLAQNKILKTTEAAPAATPPVDRTISGDKKIDNGFIKNLIGDQLQHLETNGRVVG